MSMVKTNPKRLPAKNITKGGYLSVGDQIYQIFSIGIKDHNCTLHLQHIDGDPPVKSDTISLTLPMHATLEVCGYMFFDGRKNNEKPKNSNTIQNLQKDI